MTTGSTPPDRPGGNAAERLRQELDREFGQDQPPNPLTEADTAGSGGRAAQSSGEGEAMRGPDDDLTDTAGPTGAPEQPRPRPPGGKALLRMLQLLGQAGLDDVAAAAVQAAIPEPDHAVFRERAAGLVPIPEAIGAPRTRRRRAATSPAGAPAGTAHEMLQAAAVLGPPTSAGPQWRSLGPWTVPNGQTYGASRVNVSGRVAAIAVDPSNAAHVLAGAANGGVWESFDRGASWAPRTDYQATLAVGAIAFDPINPTTVYCGLGEGNWWSWLGTGVLRSTDGGTTWASRCTTPFVGLGFYDLAVDPSNGQHLLAATNGGLYSSSDGGSTWTQRRNAVTWSIAITSGANAEVLASCSDGLFRSTDGGATYTAVTLPGAPASFTRLAVAIARTDPSVAYAWGAAGAGPTAYLWGRTANAWTAQTIPPGVNTTQSWYDWFLAVAPDNADQVYCGAISAYRGTRSGTTWTWLDIATKSTGDSIHPDQHAIAFEPGNPNSIYIGCDGGLFHSPDRGVTWQHSNNGLIITEFEYLADNPGVSRWLIGGTQDNGTERWLGSPTWEHAADGDGGDCAVNRTDPDIVFHTFFNMSPQRSTSGGAWNTWNSITPPVPAGEGSPFYPPFECSSTNGDMIAMAGQALYVSRDNGTNWTRVAYPSAGTASGMFIPDADTVLLGTNDGRILRTTWSGTAWTTLTALTTPRAGASVSDIAVAPGNSARIWVTYSTVGGGRVFRSDDGGSNWTDTTAGLPNLSVTAIALDPQNSSRVWVSASLGVYQTLDTGASWSGFASSLPNAYVGDLVFHPDARVLRAGLRNRGAWEIPVDGWMTDPVYGTQWTATVAANQSQRWFTFNWPVTWHVVWTVMPTTVHNGAPAVTWNVQVERASARYATYWITVTNLTSAPIAFEGRYCILSRY